MIARSTLGVLAILLAGFSAPHAQSGTIVVDTATLKTEMSALQLGANLLQVIPQSGDPSYLPLFRSAGIGLLRWPGGGTSDFYHWANNSYSSCSTLLTVPQTEFDTWMKTIAIPLKAQVAITVNYGTDPKCTGSANPEEAAAWVHYANSVKHYGIEYWTVGNEQYFPLATLRSGYHIAPTTAAVYAAKVAEQFYPLMKAQDSKIKVGIDMAFGNQTYDRATDSWDSIVLARAKYDFVEMHYYPAYDNRDSDVTILGKWADQVALNFTTARQLLAANHHAATPIYLGEFDRDSGAGAGVGHESVSIVDALFNAIVIGEATNAGVTMATAWLGIDNCEPDTANSPVSTAYGWQKFGSFGMFAAGGSGFSLSCPNKGAPQGTPFPKARAYQILSKYVVQGEHTVGVTNENKNLRVYAATNHGGYALLLINTSPTAAEIPSIAIEHKAAGTTFTATTTTYGKKEYDLSKRDVWTGPTLVKLGNVKSSFSVTLPPWSLTLLQLAVVAKTAS